MTSFRGLPPHADSTWPGYATAGVTAGYGLLKAYWVAGGIALWEIAPLPPALIEQARTHRAPAWFVIADAVTVVLAVAGVLLAVGMARRWRRTPSARLLRYPVGAVAGLMVVRALAAGVGDVNAFVAGSASHTTSWDLALWSPIFLVWGLLWAATLLTYGSTASGGEPRASR